MNIRPKPEQIRNWAESVGFVFEKQLDLRPYHYALVLTKKLPYVNGFKTVSGNY